MKKKVLNIVCAFVLILMGTVCLTACGPDHIDFDMFEKEYSIGSNQVGTILYGGVSEDERQTLDNWENWINENASKLSYGTTSIETFDAQTLIDEIKGAHFLAAAKLKVTSTEQEGNPRKGRVFLSGGSFQPVELDFEGKESEDYPKNYTGGDIKNGADNAGHLRLTVSWDAKVKGVDVELYINELNFSNYFKKTLYLDGRELELRVGYDLLSWEAV